MKEQKIYRALYYERVSTVHDEQLESLENQRKLCEGYLKRHPEIKLAEPIDTYSERVSGKSDARPKYQEMMKRLSQRDIDFILVKDLKRLNRSTEVAAQLKSLSKTYNFKFILLATAQIYDPNAEDTRMMYGFESLVNEEVVFRQSEYGRIAHQQKCEAKRLNANNCTFGYKWSKEVNDIVIDVEQAEVIRELFERYVFRDCGVKELRKYLATRNLFYSAVTVNKWLQETAYIGIFHINKKGSELGVGAGQKTKRYMNPKEDWISVERQELAIVNKDLFDLAQKIRASRQTYYECDKNGVQQARFKGKHIFSAKIYCGECGSPFVHGYADRKRTIGIYRDSYSIRAKNALEKCSNVDHQRIYEEDLKEITLTAINGLIQDNPECFDMVISLVEQVFRDESSHVKQISKKEKELKRLIKQAEKTKDAYMDASGAIKQALEKDYEKLDVDISSIRKEISALEECERDESRIRNQIEKIKEAVKRWEKLEFDMIDKRIVEAFIYKIIIHQHGVIEVVMNSNQIQKYELNKDNKRKGNSSTSSSFYIEKDIAYRHDKYQSTENIQELVRAVLARHMKSLKILLFSYTLLEEHRNIAREQEEKKKIFIIVEICLTL